jgi:hypothetical protein
MEELVASRRRTVSMPTLGSSASETRSMALYSRSMSSEESKHG